MCRDLEGLGVFPFIAKPGHGHPELLLGSLTAATTDHGPGRKHVVERCEPQATARVKTEAEVLGMAINRPQQHPEQHLWPEDDPQILAR